MSDLIGCWFGLNLIIEVSFSAQPLRQNSFSKLFIICFVSERKIAGHMFKLLANSEPLVDHVNAIKGAFQGEN